MLFYIFQASNKTLDIQNPPVIPWVWFGVTRTIKDLSPRGLGVQAYTSHKGMTGRLGKCAIPFKSL